MLIRGPPNLKKSPPNSTHKMGVMRQVPNWRPTILERSVNLTVIWHFLLGAYDWYTFSYVRKNSINYDENIGHHCKKYSCLGEEVPMCTQGMCTPAKVVHGYTALKFLVFMKWFYIYTFRKLSIDFQLCCNKWILCQFLMQPQGSYNHATGINVL